MRILVVDDDPAIGRALVRALTFEGHTVEVLTRGRAVAERLPRPPVVDVLLLDLGLPDEDGLRVLTDLRAAGMDLPVLVLTARSAVGDRVAGLDAGADDYLLKPFALAELLARLRALLRRGPRSFPAEREGPLRVGDLQLDPQARTAARGDRPLDLTRTEFALLEVLLRNAGVVLRREVLLERVWGWSSATLSNSLDVYIGYLRRKTEAAGEPRLLHTVRGVGYVAREAPEVPG